MTSGTDDQSPMVSSPKQDPENLVLRGRPPSGIRFRKGVIVAGCGALAMAIVALAFLALRPPTLRSVAAAEDSRPASSAAAGDLAGAPGSYSDVPRLGPPLPGDLGRPILERQLEGDSAAAAARPPDAGAEQAALERQRRLSDEQAARTSALLVGHSGSPGAAGVAAAAASQTAAPAVPTDNGGSAAAGAGSVASAATPATAPDLLPAPARPMLAAGTIIPASLVTGLNSDIPGTVVAQVTENVRDSVTGSLILVPQGARLIGTYDSATVYAQKRAVVLWQRLLLPDGSSIPLGKMPGSDTSGYSGLRDRVDGHGWELLKGVVLASLLGVGSELSIGSPDGIAAAIRQSLQQNGSRAGEQIVGRALDVHPTLTVRPGWPLRVLVTDDLFLPPWKD